jgi:MFS family permease
MKLPYHLRLCLLLQLGWVVLYAGRTALPVLLPALAQEWRLDRAQLGLISSAFFLTYTLAQLPSGLLSDRWSPRPVLLGGYFLQGVAGLGAAFAPGPWVFGAWRAASGLGQGTYYVTQYALAAGSVPPGRRGALLAFINTGMGVGTIGGLILTAALVYGRGWHWRQVLVLLGVTGMLLSALMAALVRPAPTKPSPAAPADGAGVGWPLAATAFFTMYGLYTLLTWTPYYLRQVHGVSGQAAGVLTAIIPALAIPGGVAAGWASDRYRRHPVLLALLPLAGLALFLTALPGLLGVVAGLALYGATGKLVVDPILVATVADTVEPSARGRAFAVLNLASSAAAVAAPALTGWLADATGSFVPGLALAALLHGPAWFYVKNLSKLVEPQHP